MVFLATLKKNIPNVLHMDLICQRDISLSLKTTAENRVRGGCGDGGDNDNDSGGDVDGSGGGLMMWRGAHGLGCSFGDHRKFLRS